MIKKDLKDKAVEYMGGCCITCGYSRCTRALHFHHINPYEKNLNISNYTDWNELVEELEKCVLLCSNCHMEVHSGMIDHEVLYVLSER